LVNCYNKPTTSHTTNIFTLTILEPWRGQLHAKPHVRPISCHVTPLSWQEPEEKLNKLLLMKVPGRDWNVKVKMLVVCEVPPPQPSYGPFSGTTRVRRCQKRTSGLYGARED